MAFVISDDCVMCGTCAANCPAEAISEGNGKYVINADSCMECGTCAANCRTTPRCRCLKNWCSANR